MNAPAANRASINQPATVERNVARLGRLRQKLKREDLTPERRAGLQEEVDRLVVLLTEQRAAIERTLKGEAEEPAGE